MLRKVAKAEQKQKRILSILVTAGATREPIDPVRFISNYSTGFLGYEIARQARERGHRVILISGPTALTRPKGVRLIKVSTARELSKELKKKFSWCNCLIMTAAVCDYRVKKVIRKKIKRSQRELALELTRNPDILSDLGCQKGEKTLVGFSLETESLKQNTLDKLRAKNLDLIVATQMSRKSYPFGRTRLNVLIAEKKGHLQQISRASKPRLARILLDRIESTVI